ncbi:hypothetical protein A2397_02410, partial [Candidatus Amesbacteria bacterium RIFOXYB1_FULL_44_23]
GHYDIIIDCENGIPFFTPFYSTKPVILLIHHVHQEVFRQHLPPFLSSLAIFLEAKLMPMIYNQRRIVTVSDSSKNDIVNILKIPAKNIDIVTPGIDLNSFAGSEKTKHPSLIYLGRIREYKNIDVAIQAFAWVVKSVPSAKFVIAGWGDNLHDLQKLAISLGLKDSVIFMGKVSEDDKVKLLGQSWAMLQPSSFEGWGITVIEANACGTPVIASNVIGLKDSVVADHTGILFEEKNVEEMAQAMTDIIKNREKRVLLSKNALQWSQRFDWDSQSRKFFTIISSCLNDKDTPPLFTSPDVVRSHIIYEN